jgi:hypothetical protein
LQRGHAAYNIAERVEKATDNGSTPTLCYGAADARSQYDRPVVPCASPRPSARGSTTVDTTSGPPSGIVKGNALAVFNLGVLGCGRGRAALPVHSFLQPGAFRPEATAAVDKLCSRPPATRLTRSSGLKVPRELFDYCSSRTERNPVRLRAALSAGPSQDEPTRRRGAV